MDLPRRLIELLLEIVCFFALDRLVGDRSAEIADDCLARSFGSGSLQLHDRLEAFVCLLSEERFDSRMQEGQRQSATPGERPKVAVEVGRLDVEIRWEPKSVVSAPHEDDLVCPFDSLGNPDKLRIEPEGLHVVGLQLERPRELDGRPLQIVGTVRQARVVHVVEVFSGHDPERCPVIGAVAENRAQGADVLVLRDVRVSHPPVGAVFTVCASVPLAITRAACCAALPASAVERWRWVVDDANEGDRAATSAATAVSAVGTGGTGRTRDGHCRAD